MHTYCVYILHTSLYRHVSLILDIFPHSSFQYSVHKVLREPEKEAGRQVLPWGQWSTKSAARKGREGGDCDPSLAGAAGKKWPWLETYPARKVQ